MKSGGGRTKKCSDRGCTYCYSPSLGDGAMLQDRLEWMTSFYQRETLVASSMIGCKKSFNSIQLVYYRGRSDSCCSPSLRERETVQNRWDGCESDETLILLCDTLCIISIIGP